MRLVFDKSRSMRLVPRQSSPVRFVPGKSSSMTPQLGIQSSMRFVSRISISVRLLSGNSSPGKPVSRKFSPGLGLRLYVGIQPYETCPQGNPVLLDLWLEWQFFFMEESAQYFCNYHFITSSARQYRAMYIKKTLPMHIGILGLKITSCTNSYMYQVKANPFFLSRTRAEDFAIHALQTN